MADDGRQLKVPRHEVHTIQGDGVQERVDIHVDLAGVSDAADVTVRIEPPDTVEVTVPDRYHLLLRLAVPITPTADSVRFKSKTGVLSMRCSIADTAAAAEAPAGAPSPAAADGTEIKEQQAAAGELQQQQQQWQQEELASAAAATAATDCQQQQGEQAELACTAAAAAAEAEQRGRQELLRQLQREATASAKQPTAHTQQGKQDEAAAVAVADVTAAGSASRDQQRGAGRAAGAASGSHISKAPSVPPPQGGSAGPASSSATAGSPSQPTEQLQQARKSRWGEDFHLALVAMCSKDLTSGLEQIKAVFSRPRANNPAGWANQLWGWWSYCVFYSCMMAGVCLSERVPFCPLMHSLTVPVSYGIITLHIILTLVLQS